MSTTVVVCVDGFDPAYLEAAGAPNMRAMGREGFLSTGRSMMPSVTNVNNVSIVTGAEPAVHGICSNYWLRDGSEEVYLESPRDVLAETMFRRAGRLGRRSLLVTSKDKLRALLADGPTVAFSAEQPPGWVVRGVGPPPGVYSLEVNAWALRAAAYAMRRERVELAYVSTTDYAMHAFPPDHPEGRRHVGLLDRELGALAEANPDATILLTADHGMSDKRRLVDLERALEKRRVAARAVPVIKDRYVLHHSNLGGVIYVYVRPSDLREALSALREVPGVEEALPREEAAAGLALHPERVGDIVVMGERDVVFGSEAEVSLPRGLRSHGSRHEQAVPLLGYGGDFDGFSFRQNRDVGRYVLERVLSGSGEERAG